MKRLNHVKLDNPDKIRQSSSAGKDGGSCCESHSTSFSKAVAGGEVLSKVAIKKHYKMYRMMLMSYGFSIKWWCRMRNMQSSSLKENRP